MVTPASLLKPTAAILFATPIVLLSACSPPGDVPSNTTGTTPSVWTGSPAPSASGSESEPQGGTPSENQLVVPIKAADGSEVANATFDFSPGFVTITVKTSGTGKLTPGFHGLHIHSVGKCEAASVAPTGGAPGDFLSAGGHFQVPGHDSHPASGDLTSLQVREDGTAELVTTTDAFTEDDLLAGQKTAIMIHEKSDNFANIPPERYNQVNGTPGPDEMTMATGDAGKRVACGVISAG